VYSLVRLVPDTDATRAVVAAFDVDGTLTTRDCVTPFLRRVAGRRLARPVLSHPGTVVRALAVRDNDALKALACQALRGLDVAAVRGEGVAFARWVVDTRLRADTVARLRSHRALGHRVLLASASLDVYLTPLATLLGVDGLVCTRLEVDAADRLTGRLDGRNCRGAEKAVRVTAWLEERDLADATLWAYGDSRGDTELLDLADHPVWVARTTLAADVPVGFAPTPKEGSR
jgi:phosphatidylglycerophosphatase C